MPEATEAQNAESDAFSPPITPLLSNTLIRPLTCIRICVVPTSPMVSGGMKPESPVTVEIPRKVVPTVCGRFGGPTTDVIGDSGIGGQCDIGSGALGSGLS